MIRMKAFREKRLHERTRVSLPVKYLLQPPEKPGYRRVRSADFSEAGMCFQSENLVIADSPIILDFNLPAGFGHISVAGEVVRTRRCRSGDCFDVVVMFKRLLGQEKKSLLLSHMKQFCRPRALPRFS